MYHTLHTFLLFICILASHLSTFAYYEAMKKKIPSLDIVPECILVVDCGYSFTHIIPHMNGIPLYSHIKRFLLI